MDAHQRAAIERGECALRCRPAGAISCYWQCDLPAGHGGLHAWHYKETHGYIDGKWSELPEPEPHAVYFTSEEADASWRLSAYDNAHVWRGVVK